jgi:hypothetical protein
MVVVIVISGINNQIKEISAFFSTVTKKLILDMM